MLFTIGTILFIAVSLVLALFILIQSDKGGGISGAIGGGISNANTVLGAQNTENILTRGTTILVISFFAISIGLSFILADQTKVSASQDKGSLMKQSVDANTEAPMQGGGMVMPETAPVATPEAAPVEESAPVEPAVEVETPTAE